MKEKAWITRLRPQMETLGAAWLVPIGVAIGWIQCESGGRMGETTSLDERGLFQLHPDESRDLGIDHRRLSTDEIYSLASGYKLVDYYRSATRRVLQNCGAFIPAGTEYHWRLVKLGHSGGLGSLSKWMNAAAKAACVSSWDELRAYLTANDADLLHSTKHSPAKWVGLVDKVFTIGQPYGVDRLACI